MQRPCVLRVPYCEARIKVRYVDQPWSPGEPPTGKGGYDTAEEVDYADAGFSACALDTATNDLCCVFIDVHGHTKMDCWESP